METIIISGFPGVGKTFCYKEDSPLILDSDSSLFSWQRRSDGSIVKDDNGKDVRHPDFPNNYIAHIKENIGKAKVIFVSSHQEVRAALTQAQIPFTLVYPDRSLLDEYAERYKKRNSPPAFISLIRNKWNDFLSDLEKQEGCTKIVLQAGQYLSDVLGKLLPPEPEAPSSSYRGKLTQTHDR